MPSLHRTRRLLAVAAVSAVVLIVSAPGPATALRLGVSGAHTVDTAGWDASERSSLLAALIQQRAQWVARYLGASVVRLGASRPALASPASLASGAFRDWRGLDAALEAFGDLDVAVCLTVADLVPNAAAGEGLEAYRAHLAAVVERYDGDADFGVVGSALNYEHPDVDGSGQITVADWNAPAAEKLAWAQRHAMSWLEIGDRPLEAERAGLVAVADYAAQLAAAREVVAAAGAAVPVMLAAVSMGDQAKSQFTARMEGVGADAFAVAAADLRGLEPDHSQQAQALASAKLGAWLDGLGWDAVERWVGAFSVPLKCAGGGCTEQTQAASLVKLVVLAGLDGAETILFAEPFGPASQADVLVELGEDGEVVRVRPAAAVWQRLAERLGAQGSGALSRLTGLPQHVHGARVGSDAWVLWYDQHLGTAEAVTVELPVAGDWAAVEVQPLVPIAVAEDAEGVVSWAPPQLLAHSGVARLRLGADPVWVAVSDAAPPVDAGPEAGPEPTAEAAAEAIVSEAGALNASETSTGGCAGAPVGGGPLPLTLVGLALAAVAGWRGRERAAGHAGRG